VIDTHAHLDACAEPADAVLARARERGVGRVLTVATTIDGGHEALRLAERAEGVFAIVGIHPHEAGGPEAGRVHELAGLLAHERSVAAGETGLDFFRDYAPRRAQLDLFRRTLELAREHGKPVVIHCRDAEDAVAEELAAFDGTVVLHCFSSPRLLPAALERRWYVSFAGNVTYPKADELRAAAERVPADRLLAETDAPYLSPQPVRGRPNEPANVVHTLAALADVRGVEPGALEARIEQNAAAAFSLP
jgi:TatD DNase family protein